MNLVLATFALGMTGGLTLPANPVSFHGSPECETPSFSGFTLDPVQSPFPRDIHFGLPIEDTVPIVTALYQDLDEQVDRNLAAFSDFSMDPTQTVISRDIDFTLPVEDPVTFITARHELPECIIPTVSAWTMEPGQTHIARAYLHCTMRPVILATHTGGVPNYPTDDIPAYPTDQLSKHSTYDDVPSFPTDQLTSHPTDDDMPSYPTDQLTFHPTDDDMPLFPIDQLSAHPTRIYTTGSEFFWMTPGAQPTDAIGGLRDASRLPRDQPSLYPTDEDIPKFPTDQLSAHPTGTYPTLSEVFWMTPDAKATQSNGIWIAPDVPSASTIESLILIPIDSTSPTGHLTLVPVETALKPAYYPTTSRRPWFPGVGHGPVRPRPTRPSMTTKTLS